jgi:DNA-binding transcriptional regulator YiaG
MKNGSSAAAEATILDMLDMLEAGLLGVCARPPDASTDGATPEARNAELLRARMERAGLSRLEFANLFGVELDLVHEWLAGRVPIPAWVHAAVQVLALVNVSARRSVLRQAARTARNHETHPFARIEDL